MNTTLRGDAFEDTICGLLERQIEEGRFFAKAECCRVFRKKGYYSKDRQSKIIFDLSIEISMPGADTYSLLVLVECKDYTTNVPVSDVEEFWAKLAQVAGANVKGIIAATTAFQDGGLRFAESKGFGVIRYFKPDHFKWVLRRSASWSGSEGRSEDVRIALTAESYESSYYDCCFFVKGVSTHSSNRMFETLCLQGDGNGPPAKFVELVSNPMKQGRPLVPYVERDDIEQAAAACLSRINHSDGPVNLSRICDWQREECGLSVEHHTGGDGSVLGSLSFDPVRIDVFDVSRNEGRVRFTLGHELGHLLLQHGRFMVREFTRESDLERDSHRSLDFVDVRRMEWQANCFASCLLLPLPAFAAHLYAVAQARQLYDHGFGLLYVDHQPVNVSNFFAVTDYLSDVFNVSRQATVIRLTQLGYLNDARESLGLRPLIER